MSDWRLIPGDPVDVLQAPSGRTRGFTDGSLIAALVEDLNAWKARALAAESAAAKPSFSARAKKQEAIELRRLILQRDEIISKLRGEIRHLKRLLAVPLDPTLTADLERRISELETVRTANHREIQALKAQVKAKTAPEPSSATPTQESAYRIAARAAASIFAALRADESSLDYDGARLGDRFRQFTWAMSIAQSDGPNGPA